MEKHHVRIQVVHSEAAFDASLTHHEKQPPHHREDRFTSRPQPHSRTRRPAHALRHLPPPVRPPRGFSLATDLIVPTSIARDVSYDSCDSPSVYSTVSAPISLHSQITVVQPPQRPFAQPTVQPHTSSPLACRGTARVTYAVPRTPSSDDPVPSYPAQCVDPLAPETYDKTLSRMQQNLSAAHAPIRIGYAESLRRKQRTRAAEGREAPTDLPPHLRPTLVPPSPSAQRSSTPLLYRKTSRPFLSSPFSPSPAEVW
ncbi:hypothetical protein BDN70DRAFT_930248 [Pholiota conissans]|uniref:Uncharacterized protein n=1 Tax=Pholiota conissans TaxID=109636 RepID=A0A9P6D3G9_9AGAR|nr:hypothetical protein BDN70DRAFT_930248 [Pholiota conissans]